MKDITRLEEFRKRYERKEERYTEVVQCKITPSALVRLDKLVTWLGEHGVEHVSRSSVLRALLMDSLEAFEEAAE